MSVFLNLNGVVLPSNGQNNLLKLAEDHGVFIPHGCNIGRCGACEVEISKDGSCEFEKVLACQFEISESIICRAPRTLDRKLPEPLSFPVRIERINKISGAYYKVDLKYPPSMGFDFVHGQYVDLLFENGNIRSYSIFRASDNTISLFVTRLESGFYSKLLTNENNVGIRFSLNGPKGSAILPKYFEKSKILFFGTGSGIAPIYNIIVNSHFEFKPEIHWGVREKHDVPKMLLTEISAKADLKVYYSSQNKRITDGLPEVDFSSSDVVYASGNPNMIGELRSFYSERYKSHEKMLITDPFYK